ncbi:MAG: hypothetical protein EB059_04220 [Alphaproteobacteria bacterium]|nr:hypothetical protein [Alphaproteobacteria bacterium]
MKRVLFENLFKTGLMAAVIVAACPDLSWAQDLSGSVTSVKTGIRDMPNLVSGFAYIAGGAAMLSGAGMLKKHADNPQQNPLAPGVARMSIGGVVAAAPSFLQYVNNTLKTDNGAITYKGLGPVTELKINIMNQIHSLLS